VGIDRLEPWLDTMTPEAMSLFLAWMRCQAEVRDTNVRGPLDEEPRRAGIGSQGRLQHAITVQREQAEHQRLSDLIEGLPHAHPARSAWLEVGRVCADADYVVALGEHGGRPRLLDDCLCHYLRGLLPSEVGKAGLGIPDSKLAALARRAAADSAPAPPRERICDGYGLQLETACLPGDHINERSCAICDVVAGGLPGASTEARASLLKRAAAGCARPPA